MKYNQELVDKVWDILPQDYKDYVQHMYMSLNTPPYDNDEILHLCAHTSNYFDLLFGRTNLTQDYEQRITR